MSLVHSSGLKQFVKFRFGLTVQGASVLRVPLGTSRDILLALISLAGTLTGWRQHLASLQLLGALLSFLETCTPVSFLVSRLWKNTRRWDHFRESKRQRLYDLVLWVSQRSGKPQTTEGPAQGSAVTEDNGHTQGSYFLLASVCYQKQEAPNSSAEAGQDLRRVRGLGRWRLLITLKWIVKLSNWHSLKRRENKFSFFSLVYWNHKSLRLWLFICHKNKQRDVYCY